MAAKVSSISKALADDAASIRIPQPSGISPPVFKAAAPGLAGAPQTGLPTPPNSISPNLPAHGLAARARYDASAASPPSQVDSDIELGDAIGHVSHGDGHVRPVAPAAGQTHVTPALIARDYLPDIVLGKGQVAVKDIINTLIRDLPGFVHVPPAKARRIVVAALETRNGGPEGNVEFEKTGWGRWVGRVRQPGRRESNVMHTIVEGKTSSPIDIGASRRVSSSKAHGNRRRYSHGSWTHESNGSSSSDHYERMDTDVFHNDMDEMLIDGEHDRFNRYAGPQLPRAQDPDYLSDTDEEDWASLGADALRANSYQARAGPLRHRRTSRRSSTRSPFPDFARSAPTRATAKVMAPLDFTGVDADDQEKAAIEALMKMGSA